MRKVTFKLSGEQEQAALDFSNQIGLPLDFIAKQSLFMSIQQAYQRAQQLEQLQHANKEADKALAPLAGGMSNGTPTTGDSSSDPLPAAPLSGGGPALADESDVAGVPVVAG